MMASEQETQIFADGKQVIFLWKEGTTKAEMAITLKRPIITEYTMNQTNYDSDIVRTLNNGSIFLQPPQPPIDFDFKMKVLPEDMIMERSDNGGLLQNIDIFKNVSVSRLFKVINRKLKEREMKE